MSTEVLEDHLVEYGSRICLCFLQQVVATQQLAAFALNAVTALDRSQDTWRHACMLHRPNAPFTSANVVTVRVKLRWCIFMISYFILI